MYEAPVRIVPGTDTLERYRSMKMSQARSFTSPVSWDVYDRHGPFPYSNTIDSVTCTPGEQGRMSAIHTTQIL